MKRPVVTLLSPAMFGAILMFFVACAEDGVQPQDGDAAASHESDAETGDPSNSLGSDSGEHDVEPDPDCDLTGKWISVRRTLTIALGGIVRQSGHNWGYWEFEQTGTEAIVTKGLRCGVEVVDRSEPSYSSVMTTQALWDGITLHSRNDGRRAVYGAVSADECWLSVEQRYTVRGATVPHFENPDIPLTDALEPAAGSKPGWEDWDEDGYPGVTFQIMGVANGKIYVVQRDWNMLEGATRKRADKFKIDVIWGSDQVLIAKEPESLPSTDAWASTDQKENYIWFARVDDSIVGATDLETCANMREIKDRLIPEGNE